jgi:type IV pilus assembly protein PilW
MTKNHGYTLIELLIATTVGLFVIAVTVGVFLTQQSAFYAIDLARSAQDASREAMLEVEPALRRLGYGVDPRYAIDMRNYACVTPPCRDKIDGPDEIVFVSRNPNYQWVDNNVTVNGTTCVTVGGCFSGNSWPITKVTATTLTITANGGEQLLKGRVLIAVCANGAQMTMSTVQATTPASAAVAGQTLNIPLVPTVAGNPYVENNYASSCFSSAGAGLFLVDRYRYAVYAFNNKPYLMLDSGLDLNLNGVTPDQGDLNDLIPIAKGVEDMQVAYGYTPSSVLGLALAAPDSNANWTVGDASGVLEEPNPALAAPLYSTGLTDPSRFNLNPTNIRQVRITLSVRSLQPDLSQRPGWLGDPLQLSENRNVQLLDPGRYRRYVTSTTAYARDMDSRSAFVF